MFVPRGGQIARIGHIRAGEQIFRLDGRIALVTGAAGHLGRAISFALAEAGARVLLNGRSAARLEALAAEMGAAGLAGAPMPFDVTDAAAVERALGNIARLDILVNNAYSGKTATWDAATTADFAAASRIAVGAAFDCMRAAEPALVNAAAVTGHAAVINIASMYASVSPDHRVYGQSGLDNPPFYGAAKAALLQLTRYGACALAPKRIRVNAISPGAFPPQSALDANPGFASALAQRTPLARTGKPDELRGAVLFLASDAASFITGIDLPVDGGWTAW